MSSAKVDFWRGWNTIAHSGFRSSSLQHRECFFQPSLASKSGELLCFGGHLLSLALSICRNINWRDKGVFGQNTLPSWIMECWTSKFDSFVFGRERFAVRRLEILPHLELKLLGDSFWSRLWIVFLILCPLQFFLIRDFRTISLF